MELFEMNLQILQENDLKAGDILLCYTSQINGKTEEIKYGYSHVAICTLEKKIIEASNSGVKEININDLLMDDGYEHIAVLRNDELWNEIRLQKLNDFLINKIGSSFNNTGMYKLSERKSKYEINSMELTKKYFEDTYVPPNYDKDVYFCSQLIISCFRHVNIIDESASLVINLDTYSPEDIAKDKAFGFFVGYIISYEDYIIPIDDMFHNSI